MEKAKNLSPPTLSPHPSTSLQKDKGDQPHGLLSTRQSVSPAKSAKPEDSKMVALKSRLEEVESQIGSFMKIVQTLEE